MEPQAWILRSLLEELETEEAEDQETPNGIGAQFARLRNQSIKYRTDKTYPTKTAEKSDNIKKNRYKDILPFDHSRVKLTFTTSKTDTDYINANFIEGVIGSRAYIATQGPLPQTVLDFLRMIWEYDIKVVVMACREFEMGKKKCECYWPKLQDEPFVCEPFTVCCDAEEIKGDYVTRTLRVNYRNCSRTLQQLHYVNWPDHGIPNSIPPILEMLQEMRSYQDHDDTPICIHCSAGCGRTGVLCAIDYTWNLLKKQMITSDFSIYDLVQNMRTQRPSVVQTKEQYVLVYRTIKLLFEKFLHSEDSHEQSSEVDADEADLTELQSEACDMNKDLISLDTQLEYQLQTRDHSSLSEHANRSETETNHHLWQYSDDLQVTSFFTEIPKRTSPQELNLQTQPGERNEQRKVRRIEKRVEQRREEEDENLVPCPSSSTVTVCLTVEDPYFDSSTEEAASNPCSASETPTLSLNDQPVEVFSFTDSGTLEVHSDDEMPPPLPKRTPESFEIPENAESCTRLAVVIPQNAAAAAVRELRGSPPSPVPPLPERTPESFELAIEPAPAEAREKPTRPVNLSLLGVSSEWSGSSGLDVDHNETKSWTRSKSLRVKTTFSEFPQSKETSNTNSKVSQPRRPLVLPPPPPPPSDHAVHPLPAVAPPLSQDNTHGLSLGTAPAHTAPLTHRAGVSSEWDGATQPKKFLDSFMNRSKSVRVKGSFRESLTVSRSQTPPPAAEALGTNAHTNADEGHSVNNKASVGAEMSEKGMTRSKSLKFFRSKHKTKVEPPRSQPSTPPPSYESLSSLFKFGFGTRFGKPKGPRSYPETWV